MIKEKGHTHTHIIYTRVYSFLPKAYDYKQNGFESFITGNRLLIDCFIALKKDASFCKKEAYTVPGGILKLRSTFEKTWFEYSEKFLLLTFLKLLTNLFA